MLLNLLIPLIGIVADQIVKYWAATDLQARGTIPLWEGVVHLTYCENTGAAFGMLKDHRWVFLVISTVALGGMIVYMFLNKTKHPLETTAVAFIVGGGIGNMIDRLTRGFVVDFVDVKCIPHWNYIFNVADIFVCVGCGLFILYILLFETKGQKKGESL